MNNRAFFIVARVLIPSVFVGLGLERLLVGAGVLTGAPMSAGALIFSAFELVAGLLVMLGWKVRWVASVLALFILVDAFLAHAFWTYPAAGTNVSRSAARRPECPEFLSKTRVAEVMSYA